MLVYNAGMQTMACTASLQLECRTEYDENAGIRVWCPQKPWWMSPPFPNHQIAPPKSRKLGFPCSEYCTRTRHIAALQIAFCAPFVLQHMASPYWLSRWELCQNELDFGRCLCQEMVFPKPYHNLFAWNRSTLNKSYIHSVFCQSENVDGKLISSRGTGPLRFSAKFSVLPVISKSRQSWEDELKVSVCKTNRHQVHFIFSLIVSFRWFVLKPISGWQGWWWCYCRWWWPYFFGKICPR